MNVGIVNAALKTYPTLFFNGDDAQGIWHVASGAAIDVIGAIGDDPGSGWEVAGVNNGTKDHS